MFFWFCFALLLGGVAALGYIHWYGVPAWLPIRERGEQGRGQGEGWRVGACAVDRCFGAAAAPVCDVGRLIRHRLAGYTGLGLYNEMSSEHGGI